RRHDLTAQEDLDPEPAAAHLVDQPGELLRRALQDVERRGPGRREPPLDLGLGDDVRSFDDGRRPGRRQRATCLQDEAASSHMTSFTLSAELVPSGGFGSSGYELVISAVS